MRVGTPRSASVESRAGLVRSWCRGGGGSDTSFCRRTRTPLTAMSPASRLECTMSRSKLTPRMMKLSTVARPSVWRTFWRRIQAASLSAGPTLMFRATSTESPMCMRNCPNVRALSESPVRYVAPSRLSCSTFASSGRCRDGGRAGSMRMSPASNAK